MTTLPTEEGRPTRRALLMTMAAAPLVGTVAIAAPTPADRAQWDRLLREYEAATAAREAHHLDTVLPALEELNAKLPPRPEMVLRYAGDSVDRLGANPEFLNAEIPVTIDYIRNTTVEHDLPKSILADLVRQKKAEIETWETERLRIMEETGYAAIADEDSRLSAVEYEAWDRLYNHPAPDRAALLWKLEQDKDDIADAILADARRLLSEGRA